MKLCTPYYAFGIKLCTPYYAFGIKWCTPYYAFIIGACENGIHSQYRNVCSGYEPYDEICMYCLI